MVVLLRSFPAGVLRVELGLDAEPGFGVDEGFVGAVVGDAAERDRAVAVGVGQDLVQSGGRDRFRGLGGCGPRGESAVLEFAGK